MADSKNLTGVRVMVIDDSNTIRRSAEIFLMAEPPAVNAPDVSRHWGLVRVGARLGRLLR